jgi:hypothetical protein
MQRVATVALVETSKGSRLGKGETADPPNVEAAAFRD